MNLYVWMTVTALTSLPAMMAQRQETQTFIIRGEIISGRPSGSLTVELSGNGMMPSESVNVNSDNTFEFRSATPGMHELRVIDSAGQLIHQEYVNITSPTQTISVRLPEAADANRAAGNVISLQQLRHKVPPPARKAFEKGEQAVTKHDLQQARSSFQDAIAIDPEFAEAHIELGGVETELNHLPEAEAQFQKAVELVPEHPVALSDLSIVLAKMQRMHEAGLVARRALQVAPSDGRMHYILGVSLLEENGPIDVVIAEFERAASTVRAAHIVAAELLAKEGRQQDAIQHLETYLTSAAANDALRAKAEARLDALRK